MNNNTKFEDFIDDLKSGDALFRPMLPDPDDCESAELLGKHVGINSVLFIHLLLSVVAISLILWLIFVSPILKRFFSLIHKNLKVIFYFGILIFVTHSVLIFTLRAQSLISALRPSLKQCDYQWNTFNCLVLKVPIYFCVMAFSVTHLGLFTERAIATFWFRRYSKFGYTLGIGILILMLVLTTFTVYYVYKNEDLSVPRAYCLSTTKKSAPQLQFLMMIACVLDAFATLGDFLIYHANKRLKEITNTEYSLAKSFQIRENQLSLHLILPLSVIHSCFFMSYLIASIGLRSLIVAFDAVWHILVIELLQTCVCFYTLVMILSFVFLWQRIDRQKPDWIIHPALNPTDVYFEQFRKQMQTAHRRNQNLSNNDNRCFLSLCCFNNRTNDTSTLGIET